jgi:hypothetical protein
MEAPVDGCYWTRLAYTAMSIVHMLAVRNQKLLFAPMADPPFAGVLPPATVPLVVSAKRMVPDGTACGALVTDPPGNPPVAASSDR